MGDFTELMFNPPLRTAKKNPKLSPVKQNLVSADEAKGYAFMVLDSFDAPRKSICGSLRRGAIHVHDIDLLIGHSEKCESTHESMIANGLNIPIDIRHIAMESWGSALQYFTGSREHNIWLRTFARKHGLSLSEYGFTDLKTGILEPIAEERTVYQRLGLRWLPPRYRN